MKPKAIGIKPSKASAAVGESKIGGTPDVPNDFKWPTRDSSGKSDKNDAMTFLAQINLKELASLDVKKLLPKAGMLYFFVYVDSGGSYVGVGPDQYAVGKVIFYDGDCSTCSPAKTRDNDPRAIAKSTRMEFLGKGNRVCKIFGKADAQQDDPHDEWSERYLVKRTGKSIDDLEESDLDGLEPGFTLLFQLELESCEEAGWKLDQPWAKVGTLYFAINDKDLREKNFQHVILSYQYS